MGDTIELVSSADILEAIHTIVLEKLPELKTIVKSMVPKGVVRPSLFIQPSRSEITDYNKACVHQKEGVTIRILDTVDLYFNSSTVGLLQLKEKVVNIFSKGSFLVKNRSLKVVVNSADMGWNEVYIDLEFDFANARQKTEADLPMIESIETQVTTI